MLSSATVATALALSAAEGGEHHEFAVNPWLIGLVTLVVLGGMLAGLLAFARGRDHS